MGGFMNIDWSSNSTHLILNPRLAVKVSENCLPSLPATVWLATSGTTSTDSEFKLVALHKEAILNSAESVNNHLNVTEKDIWALTLPQYHVGGLSILARCHLSGSDCKTFQSSSKTWSATQFVSFLNENKITLTSLVPTQLFDLANLGLSCPESLRAIIVGGDALSPELFKKARSLGWPILPSYGMTETSSQIATAEMASLQQSTLPNLKILPHVKIEICAAGVRIFSKSLYSGYQIFKNGFSEYEERPTEYFESPDTCVAKGPFLEVMGRKDDLIKVGGELVNVKKLNLVVTDLKLNFPEVKEAVIAPIKDNRLGNSLSLFTTGIQGETKFENFYSQLCKQLLPHERPRTVHTLTSLPKTDTGKTKINLLSNRESNVQ